MSVDDGLDGSGKLPDDITYCFIYDPSMSELNACDFSLLGLFEGSYTAFVNGRNLMVHKDYAFYCFDIDSPSSYYVRPSERDDADIAAFNDNPEKYIDEHSIANRSPNSVVLYYRDCKSYVEVVESLHSGEYTRIDKMPPVGAITVSRIGRKDCQ